MTPLDLRRLADPAFMRDYPFVVLSEIARLLSINENDGRDLLIRALEYSGSFSAFRPVLTSLVQKAGLYPYTGDSDALSTDEILNLEFHTADGLDGIVLHSMQGRVYRALMDGANVILSAPTSFGKSLLIDAMIASRRFVCIVVIVPTISLIDETRRRFAARFGSEFKVITHPSQRPAKKCIYVLTQERFVEFANALEPDFFVIDEFYKLSPNRGDDRTFVLNHAFYRLLKSGAQFFLIGPNIQAITIDQTHLNFRFFGTNFSTVAAEVIFMGDGEPEQNALKVCRGLSEPTLIFCKSAASAYKLGQFLRGEGVSAPSEALHDAAQWLRENYHPDWVLADLLKDGLAVHHGALPRSVAYHFLRLFNEGAIRFLLCTSTIIEGVNTTAKSIIIYDNKIATKKFDQFTFNNIKGRAGRMFKHFVGHVYVLHNEPQPELPLVDVPSITQPDDTPESLLVQMDDSDLSEHSLERLRYLHAQKDLPIEVIRENAGIAPEQQLDVAREIDANIAKYHPLLSWRGFPQSEQLFTVCGLIFDYLMGGTGKDGVFGGKQLWFKMSRFAKIKTIDGLIRAELRENNQIAGPSDAVEEVLMFLRRWGEFHFPRYLGALDKIQRSVFERAGHQGGNYEPYCAAVKQLFMPLSATVLEEYGIPYQLSMKLEERLPLGDDVDTILSNLPRVDVASLKMSGFERDMLNDALNNL